MEKIKKYVNHFFGKNKKNPNYTLKSDEMIVFMNEMMNLRDNNGAFEAIVMLFNYGYAKGYRAAMVETERGGAIS